MDKSSSDSLTHNNEFINFQISELDKVINFDYLQVKSKKNNMCTGELSKCHSDGLFTELFFTAKKDKINIEFHMNDGLIKEIFNDINDAIICYFRNLNSLNDLNSDRKFTRNEIIDEVNRNNLILKDGEERFLYFKKETSSEINFYVYDTYDFSQTQEKYIFKGIY